MWYIIKWIKDTKDNSRFEYLIVISWNKNTHNWIYIATINFSKISSISCTMSLVNWNYRIKWESSIHRVIE